MDDTNTTSTLKPDILLKIKSRGRQAERVDIRDRLISFEFEDSDKKVDKLTLVLDNRDIAHFDSPLIEKGNLVQFSWGYVGKMSKPRIAQITKITGFAQLTVEALDVSINLNKVSRSRSFQSVTRSQAVKAILSDNNIPRSKTFIEKTKTVFPTISQTRMTDAQFLKHLAIQEGFEFYSDFDGYHWHKRVIDQAPRKKYIYYSQPPNTAEAIQDIFLDDDVYSKPAMIKVKGIDPDSKEIVEGEASPDINDPSLSDTTELTLTRDFLGDIGAQLSIKELAKEVIGEAKALIEKVPGGNQVGAILDNLPDKADKLLGDNIGEKTLETVGKAKDYLQKNTGDLVGEALQYASSFFERPKAVQGGTGKEETQTAAKKRVRTSKQSTIELRIVVIGDPTLIAKTVVRLEGVGRKLTGNYYVKSVTHSVSDAYMCSLILLRDGHSGKKPNQKGNNKKTKDAANANGVDDGNTYYIKRTGLQEESEGDSIKLVVENDRQNLPGDAEEES